MEENLGRDSVVFGGLMTSWGGGGGGGLGVVHMGRTVFMGCVE